MLQSYTHHQTHLNKRGTSLENYQYNHYHYYCFCFYSSYCYYCYHCYYYDSCTIMLLSQASMGLERIEGRHLAGFPKKRLEGFFWATVTTYKLHYILAKPHQLLCRNIYIYIHMCLCVCLYYGNLTLDPVFWAFRPTEWMKEIFHQLRCLVR